MKAALRYLRKTRYYGLRFRPKADKQRINATSATKPLTSCVDADWAKDRGYRRSVTGSFFTWKRRPIGWLSKKQSVVATSTAEAEYRAMTEIMQRSIYAQTLSMSFQTAKPGITLENDNQPAITMIKALGATKRSKFIDLRHHYLKEVVKNNNVTIVHVPSKLCRADIFTKALERTRFEELRQMVEVAEIPGLEETLMDKVQGSY